MGLIPALPPIMHASAASYVSYVLYIIPQKYVVYVYNTYSLGCHVVYGVDTSTAQR